MDVLIAADVIYFTDLVQPLLNSVGKSVCVCVYGFHWLTLYNVSHLRANSPIWQDRVLLLLF